MDQTTLPTLVSQTGLINQEAILANLRQFAKSAAGAFAKNTERAFRSDIAIFQEFCAMRGMAPLPATPSLVADFIDEMCARCAPATIRRYVSSISILHRAAGIDSPTLAIEVKLALKRMGKTLGSRQKQASAINRSLLDRMKEAGRGTIRDLRDMAMLAVAYDTLCRRSEIAALDVEDFSFSSDGTGTVLVRRSKTDQEGVGMVRFIAPDTVALVKTWMKLAKVEKGAMFRGVDNSDAVGDRLSDKGVVRAIKRFTDLAGDDSSLVSGHSLRVGAAQDMVKEGLDILGVMQAGGWKSPLMVARYTERLAAQQGAAAQLARKQNRM